MFVLILAAVTAALGIRTSKTKPVVTMRGVARVMHFAALLFCGLFAGLLLTVLVLELALRSVDASVYTQVRHIELVGLDVLASATLLPALIATAFLVVAYRTGGRTFRLTLTALVLLMAAFGISLLVNAPVNTEQLTWTVQAPPADWASVRDRWQFSHVTRTVATVLALGCLCAAALQTSSSGHHGHSPRVGVGADPQLSR